MDLERDGSGLTNIHIHLGEAKYTYISGKLIDSLGRELPKSLRNNPQIIAAFKKVQDLIKNGW